MQVSRLEVLKREIDILRKMDHPNIIKVLAVMPCIIQRGVYANGGVLRRMSATAGGRV